MTDEKSMGKEMQELNVRDSLFDIYDKTQSYVRVTDDDQEAWLYLVEKEDESFYSKEELLDFLENNGVRYGINEDNLIAMARMLVSEFGSEVPDDVDKLQKLPGVGRKTANVVASVIYDKPVIAVDTHVFRLSKRLGLSDGKTVEAVEKDLSANIPPEERPKAHHWLILHGRYVCTARKPHCGECGLREWCRDYSAQEGKGRRKDKASEVAG